MKLVLASTSAYRKMLLERLHVPFDTDRPETDETPLPEIEAVQEFRVEP